MKVYVFILSLCVYGHVNCQTGFYGAAYSYGFVQNSPQKGSTNPFRNSSILKTGQHTLTASKFQTFRNRRFFGYNLNLHARLETFESDLRFYDYRISEENEHFTKLSFKFDWGLHWQFPILKNKLFIIPGFNAGMTVYRKPTSVRREMDNFQNDDGEFYYYIQLKQSSHLQVHLNASLNFLYQINPQVGIRTFAKLHTTETIHYYAFVLPASSSFGSEYDEFDDNLTDQNLFRNSIYNLDIGLGITFNLKDHEK